MRIRMGLLQVLWVCGIAVATAMPAAAAGPEAGASNDAVSQTAAPSAGVSGAADAPGDLAPSPDASAVTTPDGVALRFMDRPIVTFHGTVAGATPSVRAARAQAVLESLPPGAFDAPVDLLRGSLSGVSGIAFRLQDRILFALTPDDLAPGDTRSLDAAAADVRSRLQVAFSARREQLH